MKPTRSAPPRRCGLRMRWSAVALAGLVAGCAAPPVALLQPAGRISHAFVVLGAEGKPVARAITSEAACPSIELDGIAQPMDVRAPPALLPPRPTLGDPIDSKPSAFPVLTCEKAIPATVARATIEGRVLPLPKANPRRIVVIGDTGCRLKRSDNVFQDCNDPAAWPFRTVADAAAATAPDLVIHVGDYHYRESACPRGNAGCAGSPWGYGWDAWEADVFMPAQQLLAVAPWIVVRGNHESCNRAGQGWWRFLDPRPLLPRRNCNEPADDAIGDYSEPYAVPLGFDPAADTQFIIFDSSRVGIAPLPVNTPMHRTYLAQLERAFALVERRSHNFFMNHHPILALAPNPTQPEAPYPGNAGLQSVLERLQPTVLFPPNVQALLAGHFHLFEVVSFSTPQPAQFVSGNGGDWLDEQLPSPLPATATPAPGAIIEAMVSSNAFGFMTMEADGAGWTMVARDAHGKPMTTCTLRARKAACTPLGAP